MRAGFKMILDAEHDLDVVVEAPDGAEGAVLAYESGISMPGRESA